MDESLTYQSYDDKSLVVYGDRNKYQKQVNLLGGRWSSKKNGWIVPLTNKNKLDILITGEKKYHREDSDDTEDEDEINENLSNAKIDSNSDENIDSDKEPTLFENKSQDLGRTDRLTNEEKRMMEYRRREEENRLRERRKREELKRREEENNAKRKYAKKDPMVYNRSFADEEDPYEYYRSFNKKPVDFRRINNISEDETESDDVESSSTEYSDSSSDGFPSPSTPRRRDSYKKENSKSYNELVNKVHDLQRRVSMMEINSTGRRR